MDKHLPILGIETSGDICSVCLYLDETKYVEKNILDKHIHSEKIITIIDDVLHSLNETEKFCSIAVSIGPGSFTGLRIGLAAAKGIAIGKNVPVIPVPTMHAYALGLINFLKDGNRFAVISPVNRDEVYFAKFEKKNNVPIVIDGPKLLEKDFIMDNLSSDDLVFGNIPDKDRDVLTINPTALNICRWAYFFGKELLTFNHDYLEPDYLKNFVAKVKKT